MGFLKTEPVEREPTPTITHTGIDVRALVRLTRPESSFVAALYTFLGAYLAVDAVRQTLSPTTFAAFLVVGLVAAFGFVINDWMDVDVDGYGKPDRPLPSGRVTRRDAARLAVALSLGALVVAAALGPGFLLFAAATVLASAAYSVFLKRTILFGHVATALLGASVPVFGGLAAGGVTTPVWIAGALLFFYLLAQEVLYALEDIDGDRRAGIRTVATAWGVRHTLRLYHGLTALFVAAACLPWMAGWVADAYGFALVPCTLLPTLVTAFLLRRPPSAQTMHRAVYWSWYVWFTSPIPLLLMK